MNPLGIIHSCEIRAALRRLFDMGEREKSCPIHFRYSELHQLFKPFFTPIVIRDGINSSRKRTYFMDYLN